MNPFLSHEQQARARAINEGRVAAGQSRGQTGADYFLQAARKGLSQGGVQPGEARAHIDALHSSLSQDPSAATDALLPTTPLGAGVFIGKEVARKMGVESGREIAKFMEAAGINRDRIARATGWFKNGGEWKTEVSDAGAGMRMAWNWLAQESTPLKGVFHHPSKKLLDAVGKIGVLASEMPPQLRASFYDSNQFPELGGWSMIQLNKGMNEKSAASSLLHELQHAIQSIEGWPRGSSTEALAHGEEGKARTLELFRNILDVADQARSQWGDLNDKAVAKEILQEALYRTYRNHPGEVEAREVQKRFEAGR